MSTQVERLSLYTPFYYKIRIQGVLDESWAADLGMALTYPDDVKKNPVTILNGQLADQAALLGLLNRLYGLGLPLLSVELCSG